MPLEFTPVLGILIGVVLTLMLVGLVIILVLRLKYKSNVAANFKTSVAAAAASNSSSTGTAAASGGSRRRRGSSPGSGSNGINGGGRYDSDTLKAAMPTRKDAEEYYCMQQPDPDEEAGVANPDVVPDNGLGKSQQKFAQFSTAYLILCLNERIQVITKEEAYFVRRHTIVHQLTSRKLRATALAAPSSPR